MTIIHSLLGGLLLLTSCAESAHQVQRESGLLGVPPELVTQIDSSIRFEDVQAAPSSYVGRVIMVGGIVLGAKRTEEATEIEVLELPIGPNGPVTEDRLLSKGRFIAVRGGFLDPATLPTGTPVSIVGVVKGLTTRLLDDSDYTYPVLDAKHVVDWSRVAAQKSEGAAYYGPSLSPFGYWGRPHGYYPYFGRPSPFFGPSRPSPPPAPRPAPPNAPPRFRGR